jgi:hypothetical protein
VPKKTRSVPAAGKVWNRCFGMLKAFCLLIILKRVKQ